MISSGAQTWGAKLHLLEVSTSVIWNLCKEELLLLTHSFYSVMLCITRAHAYIFYSLDYNPVLWCPSWAQIILALAGGSSFGLAPYSF
jgi:hypothetical protein